ncbi:hypothetical protein HBA55_36395 [Pseudomaricurvus alkylphenolicus]|uniref:reverse transcriptase/maturase family protein n=1 Tax=Pseudomaricurvus alkylphenolicus TaxID=1306991 RepID=UPI00141F7082|nr:reverse transcriptase/maturase family protein [Pseudomaricurvus alkylphenolicus]NIB45116.1 hypothetical protein [Pseudomaricurvus alkylphenolicus]
MQKQYASALQELADPDTLKTHLKAFYRHTPKHKRDTAGVDGLSLNQIGAHNPAFIRQLSCELKAKSNQTSHHAQYRHQSLSVFPAVKPDGKSFRLICIPTVKDRLVQKALLGLLNTRGIKIGTAISYGDREGRGVDKAIRHALTQRKKHPWIYKTDVTQFFDRIDRNRIKNIVKSRIRYRSLHPLIFQAIDAEISEEHLQRYSPIIASCGIKKGLGLRQGLPLSPALSSLYLEDFDNAAHKEKFRVVRYADDLAFFCTSKNECIEAHDFCVNKLKPLGLDVPNIGKKSKSKIYSPSQNAEFLGLEISLGNDSEYHLQISAKQISKVASRFDEFSDITKNLQEKRMFSQLVSKLESLTHSYKGHYGEAENYEWFETKLHYWKRRVYYRLLSRNLGIDIQKMDAKTKVFFHLTDAKLI